jgi:hypothetical protein
MEANATQVVDWQLVITGGKFRLGALISALL